jgi:hypothetical protein
MTRIQIWGEQPAIRTRFRGLVWAGLGWDWAGRLGSGSVFFLRPDVACLLLRNLCGEMRQCALWAVYVLCVWSVCVYSVEGQLWSGNETIVPNSQRILSLSLALPNAIIYADTRSNAVIRVALTGILRRGEDWSAGVSLPLFSPPLALAPHPSNSSVFFVVCIYGVVEVDSVSWNAVNRTGGLGPTLTDQLVAQTATIQQFLVDVSAYSSRPVFWMTVDSASRGGQLVVLDQVFGLPQPPIDSSKSITGAAALVQHGINRIIYVGSAQGTVFAFDPTNVRLSGGIQSFVVGVGRILAGVYSDERIYWTTDLMVTLETEATLTSLELRRLALLPSSTPVPLTHIVAVSGIPSGTPYRSGALIVAGGNIVARFNRANMASPFLVSTVARNITGLAADFQSSGLYFVSKTASGSSITKLAMHACSQISCGQCAAADDTFCGVCSKSRTCSSLFECNALSSPVTPLWGVSEACPKINSVARATAASARGDSQGGYNITINANLDPISAGAQTVGCVFSRDATNRAGVATRLNDTTIVCQVPTVTAFMLEFEETWGVTVLVNGLPFASDVFTFYTCSRLSARTGCEKCGSFGYEDCHFCLLSSPDCTSSRCPTVPATSDQTTKQCPTLVSYDAIADFYGSTVVSTFPYSRGDVVRMGGVSQSFLIKNIPQATSTWKIIAPSGQTVQDPSTEAVGDAYRLTFNDMNFNESDIATARVNYNGAYDIMEFAVRTPQCADPNRVCTSCVEDRPFCVFCNITQRCQNFDPLNTNCGGFVDGFPEAFRDSNNCTSLVSLNQTNAYLPGYQPQPIKITLGGSTTQALNPRFSATTTIKCQWSNDLGTNFYTNYTDISASEISCPTPSSGISSDAAWSVRLWNTAQTRPTTASLPFLFYRCDSDAASGCFDCADPNRPRCRWCATGDVTSSQCLSDADSCSSGQFVTDRSASCPSLIPPIEDSVAGNRLLQISVAKATDISTAPAIRCQFSIGNYRFNSSATVSGSSVSCLSPQFNTTRTTAYVRLITPSRRYSDNINMTIYNCSDFSSSCSDCGRQAACVWCVNRCEAASVCIPSQSTPCPQTFSVFPVASETFGQELVTVNGSGFSVDRDVNYFCLFGAVRVPAASVSSTTVSCRTPPYSAGSLKLQVQFSQAQSPSIYVNFGDPLNFAYFECPKLALTASCSANCTADPRCGWCVHIGACTSFSRCSALWEQPCVDVLSFTSHASVEGGYSVALDLSANLTSGIQFNSSTEALRCHFGALTPSVAEVSESLSEVICTSPVVSAVQRMQFDVKYRGVSFFSDSFDFVNCSQFSSCSACSRSTHCGWCLQDNICATEAQCLRNQAQNLFALSECPTLREIVPSSASFGGGEQVTLVGVHFIPTAVTANSLLTVRFGSADAVLQSVANNTIVVAVPSAASAGVSVGPDRTASVNVTIIWRGSAPFAESLRFSYVDSSNALSSGTRLISLTTCSIIFNA